MTQQPHRRGFTLIELLIVIAIITLLSGIIFAALSAAKKKARDGKRIADVSTLSKVVSMYESTSASPNMGVANVVYTSLPDTSSTCASWNLPALKSGWTYNCVLGASLKKTDGTGWLPINFASMPGESYIPLLPTDPINDSTNYYRYIAPKSGSSYAVGTAALESSSTLMLSLGSEAGGFTMGSVNTLAVATNAIPQGPFGWNGSYWSGPAPSPSGGTVGTMTTYPGTGAYPVAIAFDGTNMWTANQNGNSVTKVAPDGSMVTYTGTGAQPSAIAFDGTNMWTANLGGHSVTKITPSGTMTTYEGIEWNPYGIAFDGTNMWTANYGSNSVTKISPSGATTTYPCSCSNPDKIAFDGTNMWTINGGYTVTKISPSGVATTYPSSYTAGAMSIAFDGTNMWAVGTPYSQISKIDPSGSVLVYPAGMDTPYGLTFDGANIWVASGYGGSVFKIDSSGNRTTYTDGSYNDPASSIAFDGTNMWVTNYGTNSVKKIIAR